MIWSKEPTNFDWYITIGLKIVNQFILRWEVDLTFKVTGRGRIGADGLAFWYTAAKVNEMC